MTDLAPLVNKTVPFKFNGAELRFDLSHALFSSYDVDQGTKLLLKAVARDPVLAGARRVLDSGCGAGIIGLAVAKAFPEAEVVLRDRDSLAVAFTERNRLANKLRGRTGWTDPETGAMRTAVPAPRAELGFLAVGLSSAGEVGGSYDFVLSNLPAKAGAPVLADFFALAAGRHGETSGTDEAPGFLAPGGRLAVVIVNTLAEQAALWIAAAGLSVVAAERATGHSVFVVERASSPPLAAPQPTASAPSRVPPAREAARPAVPIASAAGVELDLSGLDLSAYVRGEASFKYADVAYRARGYWGLPDFDTVGFGSVAAAQAIERACAGSLVREALVVNPGVGHLPLWIARKLGPARITAASRDLLSLAATGANLAASGGRSRPVYRCVDALRLDELAEASGPSIDLFAEFPDVVPEYDWINPAWDRASRLVKSGGVYLVVCSPTELARFEKRRPSGWRLSAERRRRGFASAAWTRVANEGTFLAKSP
jgi:SAM-dependent methyltransferase